MRPLGGYVSGSGAISTEFVPDTAHVIVTLSPAVIWVGCTANSWTSSTGEVTLTIMLFRSMPEELRASRT